MQPDSPGLRLPSALQTCAGRGGNRSQTTAGQRDGGRLFEEDKMGNTPNLSDCFRGDLGTF